MPTANLGETCVCAQSNASDPSQESVFDPEKASLDLGQGISIAATYGRLALALIALPTP